MYSEMRNRICASPFRCSRNLVAPTFRQPYLFYHTRSISTIKNNYLLKNTTILKNRSNLFLNHHRYFSFNDNKDSKTQQPKSNNKQTDTSSTNSSWIPTKRDVKNQVFATVKFLIIFTLLGGGYIIYEEGWEGFKNFVVFLFTGRKPVKDKKKKKKKLKRKKNKKTEEEEL